MIEQPVRVVHLVSMLRVGGMERGVIKIVNGLDRAEVESAIASFHDPDATRNEVAPHVPVHVMGKRQGNDPRVVFRLARLFRRQRIDIVHTHNWGTLVEGFLAARLARVPAFVHGEHGTMETGRVNLRVQGAVWRRATRVLSVSSRLADRMADRVGFPRERIHVIRNGASLDRFGSVPRAEARQSLGLSAGELVIGTVGRLVPVKDHATLLRAGARLDAEGHPCRILIVGEGPLREATASLGGELGLADRLVLIGARPDVERVLAALDVFVLSSRSEGLSNTILEAMAAGLPVVATHVGGADELVVEGETGLLVPSNDPAALAGAVGRLLSNPALRQTMGEAAQARARREFTLERMLADYGRLYGDIALIRAQRGAAD